MDFGAMKATEIIQIADSITDWMRIKNVALEE